MNAVAPIANVGHGGNRKPDQEANLPLEPVDAPVSNPLPPFAVGPGEAPAGLPLSVSRGNLIPELSATLSGCAIITAEDGVIVVEPLQYIGLSDASGRLKADLPRFHHSHGRL